MSKIIIKVWNVLEIPEGHIPECLFKWIKKELTVPNFQFQILKKMKKSVWGVPADFTLWRVENKEFIGEKIDVLILPRGFLGQILGQIAELKLEFELIDLRVKLPPVDFEFKKICLRSYQQSAVEKMVKYNFGILVAPPGSGKTVMGIELFAKSSQPCLILVHRRELLDQWVDRLNVFLGIPLDKIGIVGAGKKTWSDLVTVATVQTLCTMLTDLDSISKKFGMVIVDECHHIPASTFSNVIEKLNPFYMYGLTATPGRKNKDEKVIYSKIGQIITKVDPQVDIHPIMRNRVNVNIVNTSLELPFQYNQDNYEMLLRVLVYDTNRNLQIKNDVLKMVELKKSILVLTERKEHVTLLEMYLGKFCNVITMTGDDPKTVRAKKMVQIRKGNFQVLIATGQLMGEGVDISVLDCLFLVFPFSFEGKLIQYIGRIQRTQNQQIVYDYRDVKIDFLDNMFKKRQQYYKNEL